MSTDDEILEWYLKGFKDELYGTTSDVSDKFIERQAYKVGVAHALYGDDVSSFDKMTNEEVHPSLISSAKIATQYKLVKDGFPTMVITDNMEGIRNHNALRDLHDKFAMFLKT